MGIRFHCQFCNRRLNVKAKQAGEFCLCPDCEREIQVPQQTEESATNKSRRSGRKTSRKAELVSSPTSKTIKISKSPTLKSGLVAAPEAKPTKRPSKKNTRKTEAFRDSGQSSDGQITPPAPFPIADDEESDSGNSFRLSKPKIDLGGNPLTDYPNHVWYARHRRHGEKGPLRARDVEEMLNQRKLRSDWIVWRQDWHEWLPADEVFPQLRRPAENTGSMGIPDEVNPHSRGRKQARKKQAILMSSIGLAFLLILVLVYLLVRLY